MKQFRDIVHIDDLPNEDLRLVAATCGIETAFLLLERMPGVQLFIPKRWSTKNKDIKLISDLCGEDFAKRIWQEFAGMTIVIPKQPFRKIIYQRIRSEYKEGATAKYLAIKYGLSIGTIYNIIKNRAK